MSPVPRSSHAPSLFDIRNASLALVALVLRTTDLELLSNALDERFGQTPLFEHDPVSIDLSAVADDPAPVDFEALAALLRRHRMLPVGVEGGSAAQMAAARAAGLGESSTLAEAPRNDDRARGRKPAKPPAEPASPATAHSGGGSGSGAPTLVIDRPLRSGQQVYARNADLVVLAAVNFGAEILADGHIHVYAPLRGRAIAGAKGNAAARIFSTCMEPQLIAIAGTYRTTDTALPADVQGKPAQVRLDGDALVVEPLHTGR
ncbi:MAG TPA: septum site-determining protein MinC [Caldimonas sp.]|jgi:septum site-determining protein MinC|nr:septum site-determining protein MinC [Caldimonas sp.]HEX2541384.1 septum site-determining protein MinC [Caldimonas sp.]